MTEKVERFFADVFSIVPVFKHRARRKFVPNISKVVHQLVVVLARLEVFGHLGNTHAFKGVDDEHRVMCGQRTTTFCNDIGVGDIVLVCCFHKSVNTVVYILLDGVVNGTFRIAGASTVVVNAESATAVYKLYIETHSVELHIELCGFAKGS